MDAQSITLTINAMEGKMDIHFYQLISYDLFDVTFDGMMSFSLMALAFATFHYFWEKNFFADHFWGLVLTVIVLFLIACIAPVLRCFYYYIKGFWFTTDQLHYIRSFMFVRALFLAVLIELVWQVMRYVFRVLSDKPNIQLN